MNIAAYAIAFLALYYLSKRTSNGYSTILPIIYTGQQKAGRISRTLVYAQLIATYGVMYGVDPAAIASLIAVESEGIPCKFAKAGGAEYIGLMQIAHKTAQWQGYGGAPYATSGYDCPPMTGLFNPETNIQFGAKYLAYQFGRYKSLEFAISAYQSGQLKTDSSGKVLNLGYVKTVLDFVPSFREFYRSKMANYNTQFPGTTWDPAVLLV